MTTSLQIPRAAAKNELVRLNSFLEKPYILIGGLAVQQYVRSRKSIDIDLVCDFDTVQAILDKLYSTNDWYIHDVNDDDYRPTYEIEHRHKKEQGKIIFGPKVLERGSYANLNWDALAEDASPFIHKNKPLQNIIVPPPHALAYSKLISIIGRDSTNKKIPQDLKDFSDLINCHQFLLSKFWDILRANGETESIQEQFRVRLQEFPNALDNCCLFSIPMVLMPGNFSTKKKGKQTNTIYDAESSTKQKITHTFDRGEVDYLETIIDACIYIDDEKYRYKEKLKSCLRSGKIIPTKFLYWTHEGCSLWLDMCKDPQYTFYRNSFDNLRNNISIIVKNIIDKSREKEVDFISLGCGDGHKDALVISNLVDQLDEGQIIYYYPVDINESMLTEATRSIRNANINRKKLRLKSIIGDITTVSSYKRIYQFRENPNIFSILGNTLGNNSEKEIFDTLKQSMFSGDFILLEVSVGFDFSLHNKLFETDEGKLLISHKYTPQGSIPLVALGISSGYNKIIRYKKEDNVSIIPNTMTISAYSDRIVVDEINYSDVRLSCVHFYDPDNLKKVVEKILGVHTIYFLVENGIALLLAQKS